MLTGASVVVVEAEPAAAADIGASHRWTRTIPGGKFVESSPLLAKLDGTNNIVVGSHNGSIYALRPDGADVAGFPKALGDAIDSSPAVADTNGDGAQDIFLGTGTSAKNSGKFFALNSNGTERWSFSPSDPVFPSLAMFSSPALGDVNGDGEADVSAFALGLQGWSFAAGGATNKGWPFYQDDTVFSSPAIVDVDGDGQNDYVVGGDSSPGGPTDIRGGVLRAIRGNGTLIWQVAFDDIVRSSPSVGDIDGDGAVEIVVGNGDYWQAQPGGAKDSTTVSAFELNGRQKWKRDLGGQTLASPTLADVTGDGVLDVVEGTWAGGQSSKVFVLNGQGNLVPGWEGRAVPGGGIIGQISTADLNNDGAQDVLVPTGAGVWGISGKSPSTELLQVQVGLASFQSTPLVGDIDGNGTLSLVVAGARPNGEGIISRYDLPSSARLGTKGWHQFRKDNRHTGSWAPTNLRTDFCAQAPTDGYWLTAADGGLFAYCNAPFKGAAASSRPVQPIVGMAKTPSAQGYWQVASDGGIFAYGDAAFLGSTGGTPLNRPIVGMASTPNGGGYWLVASDGGIFAYGNARFFGSTGSIKLNQPIVGMASTPTGNGYWLVASDGGIFAFGDAAFLGSTGGIRLNKPVVGMASTGTGQGYWLVASDGGIFAYGNAQFRGSTGAIRLNEPMVGITRNRTGSGYRMVARDGGVFSYDAGFLGSTGAIKINQPIAGMAS